MKTANFKSWIKSTRVQKWGLFGVLTLALGFNLSMNPEHFNNIARHEKPEAFESMELALETPPATDTSKPPVVGIAPAAPLIASSAAQGAPPPTATRVADAKKFNFSVAGPNGLQHYSGSAVVFRGSDGRLSTMATVESFCQECKILPVGFTMFGEIDELKLIAAAAEKVTLTSATAPTAVAEVLEKEGIVKKWAKSCEKSSTSALLTCHKNRLIEMSKSLKVGDEEKANVLEYFNLYVLDEIKAGYTKATIREMRAEDCEGTVAYQANNFRRNYVGCENFDEFNQANEIAIELINKLAPQNGSSVKKALVTLKEKGFMTQVAHSKNLAIQAEREENIQKFRVGIAGMDPAALSPIFLDEDSKLRDAIASQTMGSPGDRKEQRLLANFSDNTFSKHIEKLLIDRKNELIKIGKEPTDLNKKSNWRRYAEMNIPGGLTTSVFDRLDDAITRGNRAGPSGLGFAAYDARGVYDPMNPRRTYITSPVVTVPGATAPSSRVGRRSGSF